MENLSSFLSHGLPDDSESTVAVDSVICEDASVMLLTSEDSDVDSIVFKVVAVDSIISEDA